jgi:3'-phosphoadenosine 5'-phosphosulfate (PAPS) 3'-phosphatase
VSAEVQPVPRNRERLKFLRGKEHVLAEEDFIEMKNVMATWGIMLVGLRPSDDQTLVEGDAGTIVKQTDLQISSSLLSLARDKYPGSFSEEHDQKDRSIIFPLSKKYARLRKRVIRRGKWMVDPVDGTGDRDKGQTDAERNGYGILSSFVKEGKVEASIAVRPAYNHVLTYRDRKIRLTHLVHEDASTEITSQSREEVVRGQSQENVVRVNIRRAYPEVNFTTDAPDFWDFAKEKTGITFKEVPCGGAADSLSKLVLGELDLVVARKGDWKSWDTGPFDPMIEAFGGKLTDCDNNTLGGYDREDLWHRRGVVASIDEKGQRAHDALITAMEAYKKERGIDLVISPQRKT